MTEKELRQIPPSILAQYAGCVTNDTKQRFLVDVYNLHTPLPRGIKMGYGDKWCACAVSAVAQMAQMTDIIPFEQGCWEMMQIAKQMGIWHNMPFTPQVGDIIFYDWRTKKDGVPDHVGFVEVVGDNYITAIEGNASGGTCARRTIALSDPEILGFASPNYASKASASTPEQPKEKIAGADGYDKNIEGTYVVTTALNLRKGAGSANKIVAVLPKGAAVTCNGYYGNIPTSPTKWYYVSYNNHVGFCSSRYLTKV